MIPQSYEAWRNCIENDCGIPLTKEFAQQRLAVYMDSKNPQTITFKSLYGEQHLQNIINWLQRV
ncbi:MAG: hypothetical protein DCO96_12445 [Fluviicola sp. XM-24bin1]|nr:MAG: hypothetical protein DCO96_12445 [Fluviicola sp. XM-24bin1]